MTSSSGNSLVNESHTPPHPLGWKEVPLSCLVKLNPDKLDESTGDECEIEYVDIGNVTLERGIISSERMNFGNAPSRARRRVQKNDVIISTVRTYLKAVARIQEDVDSLIVSTGFAVLRPNKKINPQFLYRLVQSEQFVQEIEARSVGVSYPAINANQITKLRVRVPPIDTQAIIANFLEVKTTQIDLLIAKKQRLIELLKKKRQATITRVVTKGLDSNVTMKPSGIDWLGSVPKTWEVVPIGFVSRSQGGSTPNKENSAYWGGDVPWVSPKDMKVDAIEDSIDHVTEDALSETALKLIDPRVVLIVVRGMILAHTFPVGLTTRPVTINQDMKAIRPVKRLRPEYLSWLLRSISPTFFAIVEESGHGTRVLRTDLWSKQKILIPPLPEQDAIVEEVLRISTSIQELIDKVSVAIEKLRTLRSTLLTAAVTGQIDVTKYRGEGSCQ